MIDTSSELANITIAKTMDLEIAESKMRTVPKEINKQIHTALLNGVSNEL